MSRIEWTDRTWNPLVGCSRVSPGCDRCYAARFASRGLAEAHRGLAHAGEWTGEVRLRPEKLGEPLSWRKPSRVFVGSMSDLFHPDVPGEFIARVFAVMALASVHTFQVLTKRPQRMATLLRSAAFYRAVEDAIVAENGFRLGDEIRGWPLPNVWLGTSVEDQRYADVRVPHLLATPAAVRFLSVEPLLGPVDLYQSAVAPLQHLHDEPNSEAGRIDWVIVGGESGPGARPVHPEWVRDLRDQSVNAGVPFFFKQWGEWVSPEFIDIAGWDDVAWNESGMTIWPDGRCSAAWGSALDGSERLWRVGKKKAGRLLDGRTWDQFPEQTLGVD